ncbi:O-antigen ligase family protein [Nostoc sp. C117]|uniref:O-antigen ligase family protein n=1 Tax=Nostoc sp. C117 TaxID=3349875 RepID=UPI00370D7F33
MNKNLIFAEKLLTIAFLMIYSGTPLDPFVTDGFTLKDGDRGIFRLLFISTYLVSLFLISLRWKKVTYVFSRDKFIWLLLGVCALSSFWSFDSDTTIRRVFGLAGTMVFGLYFASRYTLKEQLKLCAYMFGISAVVCVLFVLLIPHLGIAEDGSWKGIYPQKNILGKRFGLSGAIFFFLAMTNRENRWVLWLGYVTSAILVLFSKSTTSVLNLIILTLAFFVYDRVLRLNYRIMMPVLTFISTVSIVLYTVFVTSADKILGSIGKDTTLTGRSEIWPVVLELIAKKPWLGYGYGAFWLDDNSDVVTLREALQWDAPNSHNGFLDVCLGIGLLGILVFTVGFVTNWLRAVYSIRSNPTSETNVWLLIYFTFVIISNLTETTMLEQNSIEWVLYVSTILSSKVSPRANL